MRAHNLETGDIFSVNPTSTKTVERFLSMSEKSMITLNLSDIRFMQTVLSLSESHRKLFDKLTSKKEKLIPDEVSDELSDLCADRLETHGFDAYHSPTEEGRKLEELIDKLYA
jgi:hypothetical protein